jgi:YD repeat-containing protein
MTHLNHFSARRVRVLLAVLVPLFLLSIVGLTAQASGMAPAKDSSPASIHGSPAASELTVAAKKEAATLDSVVLGATIVPAVTQVGVEGQLVVQALDDTGEPDLEYSGELCFSSTDPGAVLPDDLPTWGGACSDFPAGGVYTYTLRFGSPAPTHTVTLWDSEIDTLQATTPPVQVEPTFLDVTLVPTATQVGEPVTLIVRAVDANGDLVSGFVGRVYFSSSDPLADLPDRYSIPRGPEWDFKARDGGVLIFSDVTLNTLGTQVITVTYEQGQVVSTSNPVTVGSTSLDVTLTPTSVQAGQPITLTVRAVDGAGNLVPDFVGWVYFSSSDPWAELPDKIGLGGPEWDFAPEDGGILTFPDVVLNLSGTQTITVTYEQGQIVGASNPVAVVYPLYGGIQRYEENGPGWEYQPPLQQESWERVYSGGGYKRRPALASDGFVARSGQPGDLVRRSFQGNWVGIGFLTSSQGGKAAIRVDGYLLDTVDTYAEADPRLAFGRYYALAGSPAETHNLEIEVLAETSSGEHNVSLDFVDVWEGSDLADGHYGMDSNRVLWSGSWAEEEMIAKMSDGGNVWFTFDGSAAAYHAGPGADGRAEVFLDGVSIGQAYVSANVPILRFGGFAPGPHVLQIQHLDGIVTVDGFEDYGGQAAYLVGRVIDAAGDPVPTAHLAVAGDGSLYTTHVDQQGFYAATVVSGVYSVQASAADYVSTTQNIELFTGVTATLNLTLTQAGSITGEVTDESGVPLSGALVSTEGARDRTDTYGRFTLAPVAVGQHTVVFSHPQFDQRMVDVQVSHSQATEVQTTMAASCGEQWGDLYVGGYLGHGVTEIYQGVVASQMSPGDWEHVVDLDVRREASWHFGMTWPNYDSGPMNSGVFATHSIERMRYDPVNKTMYAYGSTGTLYRRTSSGAWQIVEPNLKATRSVDLEPERWRRDDPEEDPISLEYVTSFDVDRSRGRLWVATRSTSPLPLPYFWCLHCNDIATPLMCDGACGSQCGPGALCSWDTCHNATETASIYYSDDTGQTWVRAWNSRDYYGKSGYCEGVSESGLCNMARDAYMVYMQPRDISVSSVPTDTRIYVVMDHGISHADPGSSVMVGAEVSGIGYAFGEVAADRDNVPDNGLAPAVFGVTFNHVYPDPSTEGVAYLATSGGLIKYDHGTMSWLTGTMGLEFEGGDRLAIDPTDNRVMYYGMLEPVWVIKSTDGGATWGYSGAGIDECGKVATISIAEDGVLYAGCAAPSLEWAESAIYRSDDGGECWYDITGDMHPDARVPEPGLYDDRFGQMSVLSIIPIGPQRGNLGLGVPRWAGITGEMVNIGNGNQVIIQEDLKVPGRGIPLEITRVHNSQDTYRGMFGYGWTSNYDMRLALSYCGDPRVVTVIHADGRRVPYVREAPDLPFEAPPGIYETLEQDGSDYILTFKDQTKYTFNASGRLMSIRDRNLNVTKLHYGDGPHYDLVSVEDPGGRRITLAHDSATGLVTRVTDPAGQTIAYHYDDKMDLARVVNQMNRLTLYEYCNHALVEHTDSNGNTTTYDYDDERRVVQITDALGHASTYDYVSDGETRYTDRRGYTYIYFYDDKGHLLEEVNPEGKSVLYTYNGNSDRTSVTDRRGNKTTYFYDTRGNVGQITYPEIDGESVVVSFGYNDFNDLLWRSDGRDHLTTYVYDEKGNLLGKTDAMGGVTSFTYTARGDMRTIQDAEGRESRFTYDAYGNMSSMTVGGGTTEFQNDILGRQVKVWDPLGRLTQVDYDGLNRVITITNAMSGTVRYTYDGVGNRLTERDALGRVTEYAYDAVYNLVTSTDALGFTTYYEYDENGNRIREIDPAGTVTRASYDALNQVICVTASYTTITPNPDPNTYNLATCHSYDDDGNQMLVLDALGRATYYQYDALNRQVAATDAAGGVTGYYYDGNDNLVREVDPLGTVTRYEYDPLDRLTATTANYTTTSGLDPNTYNLVTSYQHDKVGNLLSTTDALGMVTRYEYDALNHAVAVTSTVGSVTTYEYDPVGNQVAIVDGVGAVTRYGYDALNRPVTATVNFTTTVPNPDPGTYDLTTFYRYDAVGNQVQITDPKAHVTRFQYDALDRQVAVIDAAGGGLGITMT